MADYVYKTTPLPHQREGLRLGATKPGYAWFYEPGLGKSKIAIDNITWAYQAKHIDAALIVAPNSVQRQWVEEELPKHMPDAAYRSAKCLVWTSTKSKNKSFKRSCEDLLKHKGLAILAISYEASITKAARLFIERFMKQRRVFMVLDESHRIKGLESKVKIWLHATGKKTVYRRALTGTPLDGRPEDMYSQIRFLQPDFWEKKGMKTSTEFRHRYCIFKGKDVPDRRRGARPGNRMMIQMIVGSKNLEELGKFVAEISHRLTLDTAGIVLPPQNYRTYTFDLSPEQRRVYNELKENSQTILASGDELKAEAAITKLMRLQQIACGYVSCEAEQPTQFIEPDGYNPRLELLLDEILPSLNHQTIIWSRFTRDIEVICGALGKDAVRFDGKTCEEDKAANKARFQAGHVKYFVGNQDSGGTGLNLQNAAYMVFYANNFKYITREQAERRIYRLGQAQETSVIDIVAENTVDSDIRKALLKKLDVVAAVLQDARRAWL